MCAQDVGDLVNGSDQRSLYSLGQLVDCFATAKALKEFESSVDNALVPELAILPTSRV
jgi:hypothetical protein